MIGEKIKALRKKENLSQELFAEKLNVSRSAVAKWESNNGIPEIGNLKMISDFFSVSIDYLLDDAEEESAALGEKSDVMEKESTEFDEKSNKIKKENAVLDETRITLLPTDDFVGCQDIQLIGWNDNVLGVFIIAQDADFYYYKTTNGDKICNGLVGKKYIKSIEPSKRSLLKSDFEGNEPNESNEWKEQVIHRHSFCDKAVLIERSHREGVIKVFFDFRNDDYQDVKIKSFGVTELHLEFGEVISVSDICKIEEL